MNVPTGPNQQEGYDLMAAVIAAYNDPGLEPLIFANWR